MDRVELELSGSPGRVLAAEHAPALVASGLVGVEVSERRIDDVAHTVVQVLFDDDTPGFDSALLDDPVTVDVLGPTGDLLSRDLLDHDAFRRSLRAEREREQSNLRGVLVLTDGELPPPWIRLAFLPIDLAGTDGCTLLLRRTDRSELLRSIESSHRSGSMTDDERRTALLTVDQRHPGAQ